MMNREIGGYFELENFKGKPYHEKAIVLNCGRGCLAYLIALRNIKKVWIPNFICDSVPDLFRREGVKVRIYKIAENFLPIYDFQIKNDEWLFLNDYYGQLQQKDVDVAYGYCSRLIVDETQVFFESLGQE